MGHILKGFEAPRHFADVSVADYQPRTAIEGQTRDKVAAWVESFPHDDARGLLLVGNPGLGKTMLATAVLNEVPSTIKCAFVNMFDYERWLRDRMTYSEVIKAAQSTGTSGALVDALEDWQDTDDRIRKTRRVPLLVLDDVGKEHLTRSNWMPAELHRLLRGRFMSGRATVITTNIAPDDFEVVYGEAMASFIWEAYDILPIVGVDYRRSGNARKRA